MIKVLYYLDSLNVGGTEILALDVCRNARASGIDLTVVTSNGGELEPEFRECAAEFIRIPRRLPIDPGLVRRLRSVILKKNIAIVHAHQAVEAAHAYLASRGTGAKVVLTHHGFVADAKNKLALRFLIPRVERNLFVSEGLRQWYRDNAGLDADTRSEVLCNGIDRKRLDSVGPSVRAEIGISSNAMLFGMIANFYNAPRKDQKTLCEAFAELAAVRSDCHLLLVGSIEDGAEGRFAECVKIINDNGLTGRVHFLGRRKDVPEIIDSLDVFVLSSLHEGLPIAAIEAMLKGIPCILSDIAPLREVSGEGQAAEMFHPGDAHGLAESMRILLDDRARRTELGERGHVYAKDHFTIETHLARLIKIYNETQSA